MANDYFLVWRVNIKYRRYSMAANKQLMIFLDIDGTLLNVQQECNSKSLPDTIASLQKLGVRFGLNSNRAKEDVLPVIRDFGLDGPFILENGAFLLEHIDDDPLFIDGVEKKVPEKVTEALKYIINTHFAGAQFHVADTVKMIKNNEIGHGLHFFMNAFRQYSASIHHREDGELKRDIALRLASYLNDYFISKQWNLFAQAHVHGETVTVEILGVNKGAGFRRLREIYPNTMLLAIGDGLGEVDLRKDVDLLYAVSNAIDELKKIADGVSAEPMAKGVEEILEKKVRPLFTNQTR